MKKSWDLFRTAIFPPVAIVALFVYLVVALLVFGGLALQSWPDNPLRQRVYVWEAERLAALQVTTESLRSLERAMDIASRLPAAEDAQPSRGDLSHLQAQLAEANVVWSHHLSRMLDSSTVWDARLIADARDLLLRAQANEKGAAPAPSPAVEIDEAISTLIPLTFAHSDSADGTGEKGARDESSPEEISVLGEMLAQSANLVSDPDPALLIDARQWTKETALAAIEQLLWLRRRLVIKKDQEDVITKIDRALFIIGTLPAARDIPPPTAAQIIGLKRQVLLATSKQASPRPAFASDPFRWTREEIDAALVALFVARGTHSASSSDAPWPPAPTPNPGALVEPPPPKDKPGPGASQALSVLEHISRPRAPDEKQPEVSDGDMQTLRTELTRAAHLARPSPSAAPLSWTKKDAQAAHALLADAHRLLESRNPSVLLSPLEAKPFLILNRTFSTRKPDPIHPALTSSEQRQVLQLINQMNTKASSEKPPEKPGSAETQLRSLLDGMKDADFMILLVALGAWGATAQALASLTTYLGERKFVPHWWTFYLIRPFIGGTLAFTFYVIFRGGLMTQNTDWEDINHIGYGAIALLVGFCSTEALENLRQIAGAFFREKTKTQSLDQKRPTVEQLFWSTSDREDCLVILGDDFVSGCTVQIAGKPTKTAPSFVNEGRLELVEKLENVPAGAELKVVNPHPINTVSDGKPVPGHPTAPVIDEVQHVRDAGAEKSRLVITGRRFTKSSLVWVDGVSAIPEINADLTVLTVEFPALKESRTVQVSNPGPVIKVSDPFPVPSPSKMTAATIPSEDFD